MYYAYKCIFVYMYIYINIHILLLYIYIYIYIYKSKRKKKSYTEIVKEKIERKGDKQKTLAIEYKKNDENQENKTEIPKLT